MGMNQLKCTFFILADIKAKLTYKPTGNIVEEACQPAPRTIDISDIDYSLDSTGARAIITDNSDGQQYELLLRPEEEAEILHRLVSSSRDLLEIAEMVENGNFNQAEIIAKAKAAIIKAKRKQVPRTFSEL